MLRHRNLLICLLVHFLTCWLSPVAESQHLDDCSPDAEYDWERRNYYELLGLDRDQAKNLQSKDIRKAYRKQAQLWHPDKNPSNTTLAECTARFARIAQAYEVCNDDEKRHEYNLFLQYCDQQKRGSSSSSSSSKSNNRWSAMFQNLKDPLQVFEEFFFGSSEFEPQQNSWQNAYSNFQTQSTKKHRQKQQPIRVSKHQEFDKDPFTGEETIRILQTEEFSPDSSGRFYFRVYAQEFKKSFDPFNGLSYAPVSQPYVRDEGYRYNADDAKHSYKHKQHSGRMKPESSHTILFPGDILTPRSKLLVSPNKRYYAGLSPECELLVMADSGLRHDDDVIWSSQTMNQKIFGTKKCFATLRGPHLVVGTERPGMAHQILWFSEATDHDDDDDDSAYFYNARQEHSTYLAQLDNDGSLVVYKVWNVPKRAHSLPERAWVAASNLIRGQTRADYDLLYSPFSVTYRRCIYATGPLGCYRVARRLYELSLAIYYSIKSFVSRMDNKLDTFMDLVLEEDDFLRALRGTLLSNGASIGERSSRLVRRVMQLVRLKKR